MTDHPATYDKLDELHEILPFFDDKALPDLIQGQVDKLNALDASVKAALKAATEAEDRAKAARELSAGRALFQDKKREAIESLQSAGVELAHAVQSGAQAQMLSFEFQKRLADISKYLFGLGVGTMAANRSVLRELELRLSGASKEELSDLARQEVLSVVRQLKEQEDLLKQQARTNAVLRDHDLKIERALTQTDDLKSGLEALDQRGRAHAELVQAIDEASKLQQREISSLRLQEIAALRQQVEAQQERMDALAAALALVTSRGDQANARLRSALNLRTSLLAALAVAMSAAVHFLH